MTDFNTLDSSVWIAYFVNGDFRNIVETEQQLFTSVLSLIEIPKRLRALKIPSFEITKNVEFVKQRTLLQEVTKEIAEQASPLVVEGKLHTVDAIIYATAILNNAKLLTLDNDFRGLTGVTVLQET